MDKAMLMQYLADNYVTGIGITSALVVISYIVFSLRLLYVSRCEDMDIGVSAFIPVINMVVWGIYRVHKHRNKPYSDDDVIDI